MTEDHNFDELGANLPENDDDFRKLTLMDEKGEKTRLYSTFYF